MFRLKFIICLSFIYILCSLNSYASSWKKLDTSEDKVPNMGWNKTTVEKHAQINSKIANILNGEYYYVHSYAVKVMNAENKIASFVHGKVSTTAAIYGDKILGVQFHPEKSQTQGLKLIQNYFN